MGRKKIEIRAIKDDRNRSVTFAKRKGGLFKKAHELSVLCSVDMAIVIFGHNQKLYEFSSGNIHEILERYQSHGSPHERRGRWDLKNKVAVDNGDEDHGDVEDDEDENRDGSRERRDVSRSAKLDFTPPQIQHHHLFQHVRQPAGLVRQPKPDGMHHLCHSIPQSSRTAFKSNPGGGLRQLTSSTVSARRVSHQIPGEISDTCIPQLSLDDRHTNAYVCTQLAVPFYLPSAQSRLHPSEVLDSAAYPPSPPPLPPQQLQRSRSSGQEVPFLSRITAVTTTKAQSSRSMTKSLDSLRQPGPCSPSWSQYNLWPRLPPGDSHDPLEAQGLHASMDNAGSVLTPVADISTSHPRRVEYEHSLPETVHLPSSVPKNSNQRDRLSATRPIRAGLTVLASEDITVSTRNGIAGSRSVCRPKLSLQIPLVADEEDSDGSSPSIISSIWTTPPKRSHCGIILPSPVPATSTPPLAGACKPPKLFAQPRPPIPQDTTSTELEHRNASHHLRPSDLASSSRYMAPLLPTLSLGLFDNRNHWRHGSSSIAVLPSPLVFLTPCDIISQALFGEQDRNGDTVKKRKAEVSASFEVKRIRIEDLRLASSTGESDSCREDRPIPSLI